MKRIRCLTKPAPAMIVRCTPLKQLLNKCETM